MNKIHFTVDGDPESLIRHRDMYTRDKVPLLRIGKGGGIYNPKYDPSRKNKNLFLTKSLRYRPKQPIFGPIMLACIFWMPIAKSNKKACEAAEVYEEPFRAMAEESILDLICYLASLLGNGDKVFWDMTHTGTPDESNLIKFVEDALQKVFWLNDSSVMSMGWKLYGARPMTEMEILW